MKIRAIQADDYDCVEKLVFKAFESAEHSDGDEHLLISRLRKAEGYRGDFEQVAINDSGEILGYGALSVMTLIKEDCQKGHELVLGPLAVLPAEQGKGIGRDLIAKLEMIGIKEGFHFISILGDSAYYGRFGYRPSEQWDITFNGIPPEYLLGKWLVKLPRAQRPEGVIRYADAFKL